MDRPAKLGATKLAETAEQNDELIMELRLKSGRFQSSIAIPLFASKEEKMVFIDSWLQLMEAGINCGSNYRKSKEANDAT